MEVLILGICHEIFFFGKKRSKIRVRIIHRRALYTGKYGSCKMYFTLNIMYVKATIINVSMLLGQRTKTRFRFSLSGAVFATYDL